jgi:hypothetical protein
MSQNVPGTPKRGIRELGAEEKVGWDEVTQGVVLDSFDIANQDAYQHKPQSIRPVIA